MKPTNKLRIFLLAAAATIPLGMASAQSLFWDQNGGSSGTGGTGTWTTANTWRSGSDTGTLGNWSDGNLAVFGGTAGTVTLSSSASATGLTLNTGGYTISGSGTLTLTGTSPRITTNHSGSTSTISNLIAGSSGFTKTGVGVLALSSSTNAAHSVTGGITISGDLGASSELSLLYTGSYTGNNLIAATNSLTFRGGRIRLTGRNNVASVQTFASTRFNSGASDIITVRTGTGSATLNLNAITRDACSVVWFANGTAGTHDWGTTASTTNIVTTTGVTNNGVSYAVGASGTRSYVGAGFYQRINGDGDGHRYVQILSNGTTGQFVRAPDATAWVNTGASNTTVYASSATTQNLSASQEMYAIHSNAASSTVNLGNHTLGLNGILHTSTGTYTIQRGVSDTGKIQIGAEKDLVLITTNSSGGITINAPIVDNAGGASNVTVQNRNVAAAGVTLSGANTFSGALFVNNGTLTLASTGSVANSSSINLASGATFNVSAVTGGWSLGAGKRLTGAGGVTGAATINGTHNAGTNGVGSQAFSSTLTYGSTGVFEWDLNANSTSSGFDTVSAVGNINASGAQFKVNMLGGVDLEDAFWADEQIWALSDIFGKALTSTFSSAAAVQNVSAYGSFSIDGTSLTWTPVPEPSSALLSGLLIGAGLLRRRRA